MNRRSFLRLLGTGVVSLEFPAISGARNVKRDSVLSLPLSTSIDRRPQER